MTMIMRRATYVADNGTEFSFEYVESIRTVVVNINGRPHMDIVDVAPEDSIKEMNSFIETWNQANPGKRPRITVDPAVEQRLRLMST